MKRKDKKGIICPKSRLLNHDFQFVEKIRIHFTREYGRLREALGLYGLFSRNTEYFVEAP